MFFFYFITKGKILHFELSLLISESTEFFSHLDHIFHFSASPPPPPQVLVSKLLNIGSIPLSLEST